MSLESLVIPSGMFPESIFVLRSIYARSEKAEKYNSWSVPFKPALVRLSLSTLPLMLQESPTQLQGLILGMELVAF
uniref:Uncharacterized protein n=1 Tax=Manihot esculenta TaxID=3983 RepID=A0A2C9WEF4_MANES